MWQNVSGKVPARHGWIQDFVCEQQPALQVAAPLLPTPPPHTLGWTDYAMEAETRNSF